MENKRQGWWFPINSSKAHYMPASDPSRSLCGKWACLGKPELEDDRHDSPDNCAVCRKKRAKLAEASLDA